jgi:enoyl-[acyl-carrier protein] reductase II
MVKEQIKIPCCSRRWQTDEEISMVLGGRCLRWVVDFAASMESSAHDNFKKTIIENQRRRDTTYIKGIGLVRLKRKVPDVQSLYEKCPKRMN